MNSIKYILLTVATSMLFVMSSCGDSDYEELLDNEKGQISSFMKRNGYYVVSKLPEDSIWDEKMFYKTENNLYIHIDTVGNKNDTLKANDRIVISYIKKTLDVDPEVVVDAKKTPLETTFSTSSDMSTGMLRAVSIMRCHDSQAKVIIPSRIGTTEDMNSVTPYLYEMHLKIASN